MKAHEETLVLIDRALRIHRSNLASTPDQQEKTNLRRCIENLEKTKFKLVLDQENGKGQ